MSMGLLEWIKRPENSSILQLLSTMIQAIAAIVSLLVTYLAIRVARQSIHASAHSRVELIDFDLNHGKLKFKLYNTGPAVAFNVQFFAVLMEGIQVDPLDSMLWWTEKKSHLAEGPRYIQPNSKVEYVIDYSWVRLSLGQPFLIKYQLSSGKKLTVYMLYRKSGKISQLSITEILIYRSRNLWGAMRHPFMLLKKKFRTLKADRNARKASKEHEVDQNE